MYTVANNLNRNALGLWPVVFQSITFMAPAAAVAYSIYISAQYAGGALTLSVILALIGAMFTAVSIGELAGKIPSAGSFYTYTSKIFGTFPGFLVGWSYTLAQTILTPFLLLIMGLVIHDTIKQYLHIELAWWIWFILGAFLVFWLAYRGVRLSAKTGMWMGVFELLVFTFLAITLIIQAGSKNSLQVLNPHLALIPGAGGLTGVFQGMIYCIQAFIGFEAAVSLAEETKNPSNITKAVVWSTAGIGLFFVLTTYAGTIGWGITKMSSFYQNPDPWHVLAVQGWGLGWIIVFIAIVNSFIANSNAGNTTSTRMMYAMGRVGALPKKLATIHPVFETPGVAAITEFVWTLVLGLICGFTLGPMNGYVALATILTLIMIAVYLVANLAAIVFHVQQFRDHLSIWKHIVVPVLGIIFFLPPLVVSVYPMPAYPANLAAPIIVVWLILGSIAFLFLRKRDPAMLAKAKVVFVLDNDEINEPNKTTVSSFTIPS